jgi:hypothetical protein
VVEDKPATRRADPRANGHAEALRPGDDFNTRASWDDLLAAEGTTLARRDGDDAHWTRPGKTKGTSATVFADSGLLRVWSSNWPDLEADTAYDKFGYWAATRHGGDFQAAARDLFERGYGDQPEAPVKPEAPDDGWQSPPDWTSERPPATSAR